MGVRSCSEAGALKTNSSWSQLHVKIHDPFDFKRLQEDIAHLELNAVPLLSSSIFTKSIFCKFVSLDLRMKIWGNKVLAENNKVYLEEWLTDLRATLLKKCKALMKNPSHMSQE